jgi:hypothetical protein
MKKLLMAILALLIALSLKSTEVYVCGWWFQEYDCKRIDQPQDTYNEDGVIDSSNDDELQDSHFLFPVDLNILSH